MIPKHKIIFPIRKLFSRGKPIGDPGKGTKDTTTEINLEIISHEEIQGTTARGSPTNKTISENGTIDPSTKIETTIGTVLTIDKDSHRNRRGSRKENNKKSKDNLEERKALSPKSMKSILDKMNSESSPK